LSSSIRLLTTKLLLLFAILTTGLSLACDGSTGSSSVEPASILSSASLTYSDEVKAALDQPDPAAPQPEPVLEPLAWAAAPVLRDRAQAAPQVSALAAVVIDEASQAVLYDKDAHAALPPASLTKIATLIVALERSQDLDAWVETDVDSSTMRGSTVMGLLPGDRFTLRDLLYGLMLPSGNDAALAIGRHVSGSDAGFVAEMNALLKRFGLRNSNFANPHGLGSGNHNASAYDLAMLARYGMSLPEFRTIVRAPRWNAAGSRDISYANINTFLFNYPGADGVKTGYTRRAGSTLVASATRNGHRLYAVVLNAPSRDSDAGRLLSWAFANHVWQ
jgi:D-alanyl-D-alanine carboxypeptidase